MGVGILKLHFFLALLSAVIWLFKKHQDNNFDFIYDTLSFISIPFVFLMLDGFLKKEIITVNPNVVDEYILYSLLTIGLLPAFSITCFWFFGRGCARLIRMGLKVQ